MVMEQLGKTLLFISCIVFSSACDKDKIKNKQFTYWGDYKYSGELKTDGVYVNFNADSTIQNIVILYRDGLLYHSLWGACEGFSTQELINSYCDIENHRDNHEDWGAFIVEGMCFNFQTFQVRAGGQLGDLHVWTYEGTLLSDSSFTIDSWKDHNDEKSEINDLYVFYEVNNKPDSSCVLIDELGAP